MLRASATSLRAISSTALAEAAEPRRPATSFSSRRRVRASTSSATSRREATRSASSWRRCAEGRRIRGSAARRVPDARSRRVRPRDGLQRDLCVGRARERRPDELPQAAGRLRVHRRRLHDAGRAVRLPPPALHRPAARSRRARPLCRGARPRAGDQRRAPLVHRRPRELPAVGAREARALPLRRDLPRAPARAADVRRAHEAARRTHADLRRAHRDRARPRYDDHPLRDDARDLPRRGRARATARRGVHPRRRARAPRDLDRAVPARARLQLPRPVVGRAGSRASRSSRRRSGSAPAASRGPGSARASGRCRTSPRRTRT